MFYVLPCVILYLCFSMLLALLLLRLGKRELILVLFVRLFDLFVVCDCGTPWTFLLPSFFIYIEENNHFAIISATCRFMAPSEKISF